MSPARSRAIYKGPEAPRLNDLAFTEKVIVRMTLHAKLAAAKARHAQRRTVLVDQLVAAEA